MTLSRHWQVSIGTQRVIVVITIILFALVWRVATFGNPTLHVDDEFYFLVGQRMHDGLLPYVDIWDRKPMGLFLIYYLIAFLSREVIAYQIVAWLFVSATGLVIYRIGRVWTGRLGSLLAALVYVAALGLFGGEGGQAPVFYNLLIALAALGVVLWIDAGATRPDRRIWLAMAACGLALTVKQTTFFESTYFGIFVLWRMWKSGAGLPELARFAIGASLIGIAPSAAIALFYAVEGHWEIFWHAMVTSNATKTYPELITILARGFKRVMDLIPLLVPVVLSLFLISRFKERYGDFSLGWLVAALLGILSVPNLYIHYIIPLLLPISVISSTALNRYILGPLIAVGVISFATFSASPWRFDWTAVSKEGLADASRLINEEDYGETLLVFEGPVILYHTTERDFLSPVVFPTHLSFDIERDTFVIPTNEELRAIISKRPDVVVMLPAPRSQPANLVGWQLTRSYAEANCLKHQRVVPEIYVRWRTDVYIQCNRQAK